MTLNIDGNDLITAAKAAGHQIEMVSGKVGDWNIQWGGSTPSQATIDQIVSDAEAAKRKGTVSRECEQRIFAVVDQNAQMNMAFVRQDVLAIPEADRTADESAILTGINLGLEWVSDMRAAYAALRDDPNADYLDDTSWPDAPAELLAIVDQF